MDADVDVDVDDRDSNDADGSNNNKELEKLLGGKARKYTGHSWVEQRTKTQSELDALLQYEYEQKGKEGGEQQQQQQEPAFALFVSGDRSQVGKSSTCLALLGSLLSMGFKASELGYIKPATQCETPQLVTRYCFAKGIDTVGVSPLIFFSGFTREFLKGNLGTSEELLSNIKSCVDELRKRPGKKIVIVDGVGYPAVGSIVGVSNADVARTLQIPVLLVGPKGVGNAVDSHNLNSTFFMYKQVKVLGAVFNRLPLEGFYSLDNCREAVTSYFEQYLPDQRPFGFVPELPELVNASPPPPPPPPTSSVSSSTAGQAENLTSTQQIQKVVDDVKAAPPWKEADETKATVLIENFLQNVDVSGIVQATKESQQLIFASRFTSSFGAASGTSKFLNSESRPSSTPRTIATSNPRAGVSVSASASASGTTKKRSREEIVAEARKKGATAS